MNGKIFVWLLATLLLTTAFSADRFERIAVRRDFEKRIPRDCHVAIACFPLV
ncbi:MAG TPA: hypothetical protein VFF31_29315 [Blastocatellia bacterium]|jgi:hypothetical protein|nr:hypothetical protein [Blastocatellia bacterium]